MNNKVPETVPCGIPLRTVFYPAISGRRKFSSQKCDFSPQNSSHLYYSAYKLAFRNLKKPQKHFTQISLLQISGKSLIKIINNKGPKTVPCGIPLRTLFETDNTPTPFILTCCSLWHKKALIHAISFLSPYMT